MSEVSICKSRMSVFIQLQKAEAVPNLKLTQAKAEAAYFLGKLSDSKCEVAVLQKLVKELQAEQIKIVVDTTSMCRT